MATDVEQTNRKLEKQKAKKNKRGGHTLGQIGLRNYRRNDSSRRRDFSSVTDTDEQNEQLRYGMSMGRAGEELLPTLSSQCSQHGRDMWLVRARRLIETHLDAAV